MAKTVRRRTNDEAIEDLVRMVGDTRFSRRDLAKRAAALGLAAPAVGLAARGTWTAAAQGTEPTGKLVISMSVEPDTLENWKAYQHRRPPDPAQRAGSAAQPRSRHQRAGRRAGDRLGADRRPDLALHPPPGRDLPQRRPLQCRGRRIRHQLHLVAGERVRDLPVHRPGHERHRGRRVHPRRRHRRAGPDPARRVSTSRRSRT